MAQKKKELSATEVAEQGLICALATHIEWEESKCYYDEAYGGHVRVDCEPIVASMKEAVKCWVREVIEEMEDEKS